MYPILDGTQTNGDKVTQDGWLAQFSKSLILAASSIAAGWVIGKLWRGSESNNTSSLDDRTAVIEYSSDEESLFSLGQKIDIVYREAIEFPLQCTVGLFAGSAGSVMSANIVPFMLGASFCIPAAQAEIQEDPPLTLVPSDSAFRKQWWKNTGVMFVENQLKMGAAAFGAGIGALCVFTGGSGCVAIGIAGAVFGEGLSIVADEFDTLFSKNDYLKEEIDKKVELARKTNSNIDLEQMFVDALVNEKMDGNEILLIKRYLQHIPEIHREQKKELSALSNLLDEKVEQLDEKNEKHHEAIQFLKEESKIKSEKIDDLVKAWEVLNSRLARAEKGNQINKEEIKALAKSVKNSLDALEKDQDQIKLRVQNLEEFKEYSKIITNYLVEQATNISIKGFESNLKIMTLHKEIKECWDNKDQICAFKKARQLADAKNEETANQEKFDETIRGVDGGFRLIATAFKFLGNPKAAHAIGTVGQSAVKIANSINLLKRTKGIEKLSKIADIAEAVFSIFSLFFGGPSDTELILEAIQALSKQLEEVRKEMHKRFDNLDMMIEAHHRYVTVRFDQLLEVMAKLHKQVIVNFFEIKDDIDKIKKLAIDIERRVGRLENKIDEKFILSYVDDYESTRIEALRFHQTNPNERMSPSLQKKYFNKFSIWAEKKVVNRIVTGSSTHRGFEKIAEVVRDQGIGFNIQSLADLATTELQLQEINASNLPNPFLWVDAVDTFLEFLWNTHELKVTSTNKLTFNKIRETGARFQKFVLALQSSPDFYQRLSELYQKSLQNVQNVLAQLVVKSIQEKSDLLNDELLRHFVNELQIKVSKKFTDLERIGHRHKTYECLKEDLYDISYSALLDTLKVKELDSFTKFKLRKFCHSLIWECLNIDTQKYTKKPLQVLSQDDRFYKTARIILSENIKLQGNHSFTEATIQNITLSAIPENLKFLSAKLISQGTQHAEQWRKVSMYPMLIELESLNEIYSAMDHWDPEPPSRHPLYGLSESKDKFPADFAKRYHIKQMTVANGCGAPLHVCKFSPESLSFFKTIIPQLLTKFRKEYFLTDFDDLVKEMDAEIVKLGENHQSEEKIYRIAQRHLKALSQVYPGIRQIENIQQRVTTAIRNTSKMDAVYLYLLHHLSLDERETIKKTLLGALSDKTSPLNTVLKKVETFHVLLEAYIRLGFNHDFYHNYDFRMLFENLWSVDTLRHKIEEWNTKRGEEMPYIQIADKAMPNLDELHKGILNRIAEIYLNRDDSLETAQQWTGYDIVDSAQIKLSHYETLLTSK